MQQNNKREFNFFPTLMKRVYYPGSGKDVNTLKFILTELKYVEDIVFCDYIELLKRRANSNDFRNLLIRYNIPIELVENLSKELN